jgi:hypothetical protein
MMRNPHELRASLPWYVNGTLDTSTRRDLETQLEASPSLRSELAWLRLVRSQIRDPARLAADQRAADAGLDTLMALIHGEQAGKVVPLRTRLLNWVGESRRLPWSMAIAAAVMLSQAVIIGALLDRPASDPITSLSGAASASGPLLQITFQPTATETQIRAVLSSVRGEIVAGPGALGVYAVRVPDGQGPLALKTLSSASTVIDSVALMPGR